MKTVRILMRSLREYRGPSLQAPLFMVGEAGLECILPLMMAELIDTLTDGAMGPILRIGLALVVMSVASLACGVMSGVRAATAAAGLARNLRQDLFFRVQDFSFADIDRFSASSLVTRCFHEEEGRLDPQGEPDLALPVVFAADLALGTPSGINTCAVNLFSSVKSPVAYTSRRTPPLVVFDMNRYDIRAGFDKRVDMPFRLNDHQVHVQRRGADFF